MDIKRRVIIQAVKTAKNELIPIWDERITFEKSEMYGNLISVKGERRDFYTVVECIFDLKTKKLELGIEYNYYPDKLEFTKGETVYLEETHRNLVETKLVDIVYEEYDLEIKRGNKLDDWWLSEIKDLQENSLYAIKLWKPVFVLENGVRTQYVHKLWKKSESV